METKNDEELCDLCRDWRLGDCDTCENNSREPLTEAQDSGRSDESTS